jgi:hypothetical protein
MAELAKGEHDACLAFLHDEESAHKPKEKNHHPNDASADTCASRITGRAAAIATATTTPPAEKPVQALVEVSPQLIKIGRAIIGPFVIAPRFLLIVLRPTSPARIVERKFQTEFFED